MLLTAAIVNLSRDSLAFLKLNYSAHGDDALKGLHRFGVYILVQLHYCRWIALASTSTIEHQQTCKIKKIT